MLQEICHATHPRHRADRPAAVAETPPESCLAAFTFDVWLSDFWGQRAGPLQPGHGELRRRPVARCERASTPAVRSPGRSLGRRVRRRCAGGGALDLRLKHVT